MKTALRLCIALAVSLGLFSGTANAQIQVVDPDEGDRIFKIDKLFDDPWAATHSDFAFWGNYAALGWYTASTGGVHLYDISDPANPDELRNFACNGSQNDPIFWDRNGNDAPDLMLLAVDRTMEGPDCDDAVATRDTATGPVRFDAQPDGWEGVRVFEMSDGSGDYRPGAPFSVIDQVDAQYTDCGAHTITANTKFADDSADPRLVVYVSSYPLRPGPTCGQTTGGATLPQLPYQNVNNPFEDASDREVENELHGAIQVLNVPLDNPEDTSEIAEPEISYPGDPDEIMDWCERSVTGSVRDAQGNLPACPGTGPGGFEPAAIACHDIVVHPEDNIAGGACAEQGQVWEVDEDGIPMTEDPMAIGDDKLSSGGTGQFPGAVDFFHSVMFDNGMDTVNWVDESFGRGCPPMTEWRARPWHAASREQTGSMFFSDMEGNFQSEFSVGDVRPDPRAGEYCSAHMGMTVTGIKRDLLVNAWYTGGVNVIDFTKPTRLKEVAYYDMARQTGTWSAYPYTGPMFKKGPGVPVYASDGVEINAQARGLEVYRPTIEKPAPKRLLDHLNPQTMDFPEFP